jgi:hypothetical protein
MQDERQGKRYRKLTVEQFRQVLATLAELKHLDGELREAVRAAPKDRLDAMLEQGFAWASIYELPLMEHLALVVLAIGKADVLHQAAQSDDPQQMILDNMAVDDPDDWEGGDKGLFEKRHVVGLAFALQRSIISIMTHYKSLSALVQEVREGNDRALFQAVRIDRSITACPTIADRIAKAELADDRRFFIHLRNALKGKSAKHWQAFDEMRYAFALLRELGIDDLSDEELERLLVDDLGVYKPNPNARENLRKHYQASKRVKEFK